MSPEISVIIKTHNPKPHYLNRVLDALKAQTLPVEQWELLVVDNASSFDVRKKIDLSWHPHSRCIREERLGIIYALLCGIQASIGEVLVMVDDDNVLERDYLETVLAISHRYPVLGTWGGQNIPEFEEVPPEWTKPFWSCLALRELDRDKLSYIPEDWQPNELKFPYGAGGCYRRIVAEAYANLVMHDPRRTKLGRKGSRLLGGEDIDMACTTYDVGLGSGLFKALKLVHIIPKGRLNEAYLLKIKAGYKYADLLLLYIRGQIELVPQWKHLLRLVAQLAPLLFSPKAWFMQGRDRQFYLAERQASWLAMIEIFELQQSIRK